MRCGRFARWLRGKAHGCARLIMDASTEPASNISTKKRSTLWLLVRLFMGLGITAFLIWQADLDQFLGAITAIDPFWLAMAFVVQIIGKFVWAWRWSVLLDIFKIKSSAWRLVKGVYVGVFFSNFLPTNVGGDLYRAFWILDDKQLYTKSIFIVFMERFIGVVALAYLALLPFLLLLRQGFGLWDGQAFALLVLVALCLVIFALHPAVFDFVDRRVGNRTSLFKGMRRKVSEALHVWHGAGMKKWRVFLLSLGLHLVGVAFFYCLGQSMGLPMAARHYLVIVPLTVVVMVLPISFNGLGLREGTLVLLTSALGTGVSPAEAIALGLLSSVVSLLVSLLGMLFYVSEERREVYVT